MKAIHNILCSIVLAAAIACCFLTYTNVFTVKWLVIGFYIIIFLMLWMLISTNLLRWRINRFYREPVSGHLRSATSLMNKTIKAAYFIGERDLIDLYYTAEKMPDSKVVHSEKRNLYTALSNMNIVVMPPSERRGNTANPSANVKHSGKDKAKTRAHVKNRKKKRKNR